LEVIKNIENSLKLDLINYGLKWIKCDLHLHSLLVHSFTLPSGIKLKSKSDIKLLMEQYIAKLEQEKIKLCAIKDYQQIRIKWFPGLQYKASEKGIDFFRV
jgi:hypothetical protein